MRSLLLAALVLFSLGSVPAGVVDLPVDVTRLVPTAPPDAPTLDGTLDDAGITVPREADDARGELPWGIRAPTMPPLDTPTVAAASTAGGAILLLAGFALYSRLSRSELLDHKRRDAVLALIKDVPGISLTEIGKRVGLAWGTAVYHLERLERAGYVTSEKASGRRCYFPVGGVARAHRPGLSALQAETTRDVAALVLARPGLTQSDLCEGLGLSASAASKQVSKLEGAGLVRREREWKSVRLHPGPTLAGSLGARTALA